MARAGVAVYVRSSEWKQSGSVTLPGRRSIFSESQSVGMFSLAQRPLRYRSIMSMREEFEERKHDSIIPYLRQQLSQSPKVLPMSNLHCGENSIGARGKRIQPYSSRTRADGKDLLHRVKCQSCGLIGKSMTHRLQ